jgi:hypothetical protein
MKEKTTEADGRKLLPDALKFVSINTNNNNNNNNREGDN